MNEPFLQNKTPYIKLKLALLLNFCYLIRLLYPDTLEASSTKFQLHPFLSKNF